MVEVGRLLINVCACTPEVRAWGGALSADACACKGVRAKPVSLPPQGQTRCTGMLHRTGEQPLKIPLLLRTWPDRTLCIANARAVYTRHEEWLLHCVPAGGTVSIRTCM